ncbi:hypothetical protein SDC9_110177 [bioreactor metagenome]|uniref:Uncharacterized protein n=1 Tax=bioreactor metagenome TaxID=1076179 RepID=A0A645BD92_9ZZZZ
MAVQFVRRHVEYAIQFQHRDAVLKLEGSREDRQPLANIQFRVLGCLRDLAQSGRLLQLVGDGIELPKRVRLRSRDRHRGRLYFRPGHLRDSPHLLADRQGFLDDQVHADHVGQNRILLATQNVVDLRVDLLQVLDDFVHLLLHRLLLHHGRQRRQHQGPSEKCSGSSRDLDPSLDLARPANHGVADPRGLGRHEAIVLDSCRRLRGQLDPAARVRRKLRPDLRRRPSGAEQRR